MARWTDEFLWSMRQKADPVADEVVAALFHSHGLGMANALLREMETNGCAIPDSVPEVMRQYLTTTSALPDWMDPQQLEKGERLFARYGPQIIVIFHCYSLPFCYAARRGVKVLHRTNRLADSAQRRIVETAQMIVDVMAPGGLTLPKGRGIRILQKVRLMHAAVRRMILNAGDWDTQELGLPINQEDMVGTLNSLGWIVLDGLLKLGVDFTPEETRAYLHAWNVVGHVMGVERSLMPETFEEGKELADSISRRHFEACEEGQEMQQALLKMLEYQIPGDVFDGIPSSLTRMLLGNRVADVLKVPDSDWTSAVFKPIRFLSMVADVTGDHASAVSRMSEVFGRQLFNALVWMKRGKERPRFSIPEELLHEWKLNRVG